MLLLSVPALAEDPPGAARARAKWDWTGFYVGGHLGAFGGFAGFSNPEGPSLFGDYVWTPGFMGGLQAGYNWQFAPQWMTGLEASGSVLSSQGVNTCLQSSPTIVGSNCSALPREIATLTGRVGYLPGPRGRTVLFGKGGVAWMHSDVSINPNNAFGTIGQYHGPLVGDPIDQQGASMLSANTWGWTAGAGVEYALSRSWSLDAEYDYLRFNGIGITTPATFNVATGTHVTAIPAGGISTVAQDLHVARLGVNYRWGIAAKGADADDDDGSAGSASPPWHPGWEFDLGTRYWYSSGRYQATNGDPNVALSRLSYEDITGQSAEIYARLDSPFDVFVKGFFGGGIITKGSMIDEDWGHDDAGAPESYSNTQSGLDGSFNYLTFDIGYDLLRGPDHKLGAFVGYNRYQLAMNAWGCAQQVVGAGTCAPTISPLTNGISEDDTWQSLRAGISAEAEIFKRFTITGDFAYLPYVYVDALDTHRLRNPVAYFPVQGIGNGVQAELIFSYRATDAFSVGVGGRYWAMWTTSAAQLTLPSNTFTIDNERYGVFLQASYKFSKP